MKEAKLFGENDEGVHLLSWGEYTLCGDALEGHDGEIEVVRDTKIRVVTCERCKRTIELCRGVRTA